MATTVLQIDGPINLRRAALSRRRSKIGLDRLGRSGWHYGSGTGDELGNSFE